MIREFTDAPQMRRRRKVFCVLQFAFFFLPVQFPAIPVQLILVLLSRLRGGILGKDDEKNEKVKANGS